ncbi:MAG: RNA-binding protein [Elusimicrobia bacterium]|nr:RNA-binding protein [Elusimicrobiota bacterium]
MGKRLFVGNLPYDVTEAMVKEPFSTCGKVISVRMIIDRESGRFKGFAFVEMSTDAEATAAITTCNNKEIAGRRMIVSEARPMGEKPAGGAPRPGGFGGPRPGGFGSPRPGGPGGFSRPGGGGGPAPSGPPAGFGAPSRDFGGRGRKPKAEWEKRRDERERSSAEEKKRGGGDEKRGGHQKIDFGDDDDGGDEEF